MDLSERSDWQRIYATFLNVFCFFFTFLPFLRFLPFLFQRERFHASAYNTPTAPHHQPNVANPERTGSTCCRHGSNAIPKYLLNFFVAVDMKLFVNCLCRTSSRSQFPGQMHAHFNWIEFFLGKYPKFDDWEGGKTSQERGYGKAKMR